MIGANLTFLLKPYTYKYNLVLQEYKIYQVLHLSAHKMNVKNMHVLSTFLFPVKITFSNNERANSLFKD
jgi:hypothetical protein